LDLRGGKDPFEEPIVVTVNGQRRDLRIQHKAAIGKYKIKKLRDAVDLFDPIASISNRDYLTFSREAKHLIDIARTFTSIRNQSILRNADGGWLPETLVLPNTDIKNNQLTLYPNPANETFELRIEAGNYQVEVFDALGKLIDKRNMSGQLSMPTNQWQNGIYMVKVMDTDAKKEMFGKVVVQH
jgi:hypothetical protein